MYRETNERHEQQKKNEVIITGESKKRTNPNRWGSSSSGRHNLIFFLLLKDETRTIFCSTGWTIGRRRSFHDDGQSAAVAVDEIGVVVVVVDGWNGLNVDGMLLLLLLLLELIQQGRLEVANVIDDVVDDFHLGDFAILRHVGHQFTQFTQIHLNFNLFVIVRSSYDVFANFAVQYGAGGWWGRRWHWFALDCLHHFGSNFFFFFF